MLRSLRWAKAARQTFSTKNTSPQEDSTLAQQKPPILGAVLDRDQGTVTT